MKLLIETASIGHRSNRSCLRRNLHLNSSPVRFRWGTMERKLRRCAVYFIRLLQLTRDLSRNSLSADMIKVAQLPWEASDVGARPLLARRLVQGSLFGGVPLGGRWGGRVVPRDTRGHVIETVTAVFMVRAAQTIGEFWSRQTGKQAQGMSPRRCQRLHIKP